MPDFFCIGWLHKKTSSLIFGRTILKILGNFFRVRDCVCMALINICKKNYRMCSKLIKSLLYLNFVVMPDLSLFFPIMLLSNFHVFLESF